ncbi:ribonuclease R [Prevotella sp. tf2-5]|uniref:ribonuclease R n=1 Tax=Prevotella sp. tf2-5 TaxID=1761889 RepID=UPI0008EA361F|nr:ribonuclease R [Prevotella sp. tf2-5]SFO70673.1 ribonuclease R [Prevotella sp. tf2-5]
MSKKKGGKRVTKRQMVELLQTFFQEHPNEIYSFKQIFRALKLDTHPAKMLAIDTMDEMTWDDYLTKTSDNSFRLNLKTQVQEGTFIRKANGKNSFQPDDGGKPIFISERNSMFALNGDRVKVTMMARRQNHIKEAMVVEILSHKMDQAVGKLQVEKDFAFLVTEGNIFVHDILIPKKKLKGGKTGDKAVVKITQWPSKESKNIVGEVIDVLGKEGDNNVEMHAILAQYGLPYKYPKNVEDAAEKIEPGITEQEIKRREDFRDVFTCTIDPKDAKDFDDALSIRPAGKGLWEVGIHIADVSHYVKEGSIIDKEAVKRATSIYLVDRTIPMLPERLCNFICSLRPDEEKLTYSVIVTLDEEANIKKGHIAHTVIKSNRRYAYEEVQDILESQKSEVRGKKTISDDPYTNELCTLDRLAKKLREKRFKGGAVKFDREELHFDIDKDGKPVRAYFKKSTDATQLIEEFMLLANKFVAESVGKVKKGTKAKTLPYRIHDQPDPTKLETLREFVVKFGYKMKTSGTKGAISKSLNALMDGCQGKKEQKLIETVALRAMMKAKYSTHNIGHYGLAFDYYTHFTSPIRRYPDTMVHRLLTKYQDGARSANQDKYEELCEHCSDMELVAQQAERDSIKYKMVEFMVDKVGETYDAHISGIQSYGIYCEIDENHCEGMVPMRDLDDDYYEFDEKNYCLIGRRHHHKYQLGDSIRIKVARANIEKRQLDFSLAED